jgi:hypothetical protein
VNRPGRFSQGLAQWPARAAHAGLGIGLVGPSVVKLARLVRPEWRHLLLLFFPFCLMLWFVSGQIFSSTSLMLETWWPSQISTLIHFCVSIPTNRHHHIYEHNLEWASPAPSTQVRHVWNYYNLLVKLTGDRQNQWEQHICIWSPFNLHLPYITLAQTRNTFISTV